MASSPIFLLGCRTAVIFIYELCSSSSHVTSDKSSGNFKFLLSRVFNTSPTRELFKTMMAETL